MKKNSHTGFAADSGNNNNNEPSGVQEGHADVAEI